VLNNILKASNKSMCVRCFNWKQAFKLDLIKNDPSDMENPTTQKVKKGKFK